MKKINPKQNSVYTLRQVLTELDLDDCPNLEVRIGLRRSAIQYAHITDEMILAHAKWPDTKWVYRYTTDEEVPVFTCHSDSEEALLELLDFEPEVSPYSDPGEEVGFWVVPKDWPRSQAEGKDEQPYDVETFRKRYEELYQDKTTIQRDDFRAIVREVCLRHELKFLPAVDDEILVGIVFWEAEQLMPPSATPERDPTHPYNGEMGIFTDYTGPDAPVENADFEWVGGDKDASYINPKMKKGQPGHLLGRVVVRYGLTMAFIGDSDEFTTVNGDMSCGKVYVEAVVAKLPEDPKAILEPERGH